MTEGAPEQPQPARGAGGPHHRTTFARAPAAVCHSSGGQAQLTRVTEADTTRPPCAVAGGNAGRVTTVRAGPLRGRRQRTGATEVPTAAAPSSEWAPVAAHPFPRACEPGSA